MIAIKNIDMSVDLNRKEMCERKGGNFSTLALGAGTGLVSGSTEGIDAFGGVHGGIESGSGFGGETDRHSDISSKLQVEMNTKSSITGGRE